MLEKELVQELSELVAYFSKYYAKSIPQDEKAEKIAQLNNLRNRCLCEIEDVSLQYLLNSHFISIIEVAEGKYCSDEDISKYTIAHLSLCIVRITYPELY